MLPRESKNTPKKTVAMFTRNPRFASTCPERIVNAIDELKGFWRLYKRRLEDLKKGCREKWPAGALKLPSLIGVACLGLDKYPNLKIEYEPFLIS